MAGGKWLTQNKVRPGVYENFESVPEPIGTMGERGTATLQLPLSWGPSKQIIKIESDEISGIRNILGYDILDKTVRPVREALKRAKTLFLYRLNSGTKATATAGGMTLTAKYAGKRGNDLTVVTQANIDVLDTYDVQILLDSAEVFSVEAVAEATNIVNPWVEFGGALEPTAGTPLTGGTDGEVTNQDHADYLAAIETQDFNTIGLMSTDPQLKSLYVSFIKRLRDGEGKLCQLVLENYPLADTEGVISVKNGVQLADGSILEAVEAIAWVTGATAGANVNESLTYQPYDDAIDAVPRYTNSEIITALQNGEFLFTHNDGRAIVEQDINTFTTFTPKKRKHFSKNRVIRTLDGLGNDYNRIFSRSYIGKVDNNDDGRSLFRAECINMSELYESVNAIQNFTADDVIVEPGAESDAVYIKQYVHPVDAAEKFYFDFKVR